MEPAAEREPGLSPEGLHGPQRVGEGRAVVVSLPCPGREGPNEDAAAVVPVDARRGLLVVADGVGGHPAGAEAARRVVGALRSVAADENGLRTAVLDAIERANREIRAMGVGAATTVAVAELDGARIRPYHVGDSAILVVGQRGKLKLRTVAHSPVGYALEAGLIDEASALEHRDRHVVSNVVGTADMRIEVGSFRRLAPRDTVVLATDGVLDNLRLEELADAVRTGSLEEAARRLRVLAAARMAEGKPDDLTFILYRRS